MWSTFSPLDHWGLLRFKVTLPEERLSEPGRAVPATVQGLRVAAGTWLVASTPPSPAWPLQLERPARGPQRGWQAEPRHPAPPASSAAKAHAPGCPPRWQGRLALGDQACCPWSPPPSTYCDEAPVERPRLAASSEGGHVLRGWIDGWMGGGWVVDGCLDSQTRTSLSATS